MRSAALPVIALLVTLLVVPVEARPVPARLQRISFERTDYAQTARLHLTSRVGAFSDPEIQADGSIRIVLYDTGRGTEFTADEPAGAVQHYQARESVGRLVVTFQVDSGTSAEAFRDRDSPDLIVAFAGRSTRVDAVGTTSVSSRQPGVTPASGASSAMASEASAASISASLQEAASRWRIDTIVIDAGHGGKDPGAVGHGGVHEKDIVLPIALQLGEYLEDFLGVRVVFTRSGDRFIELRERGRIANREGADLFVSIHGNWARSRQAHGTETFFLGKNKEGQAQSVIERENSVIQLEQDPTHYDQFDQAALMRLQLAQSAFLRQSAELAGRIERQFSTRVGRRSRGVKEGNLQVLWAAAMPAVLVEVGFISNASESRFLRSADGISYMASAIYRSIRDYKEAYERSLRLAGTER